MAILSILLFLSGLIFRRAELLLLALPYWIWTLLPLWSAAPRFEVSVQREINPECVHRSRKSGAGGDFLGTRVYVPGDPPRYLNWKAGARWDMLVTNLFEQERVADVGIILDARLIADIQAQDTSLFEHSIRAAASLSHYFLETGNRVGLLIYGAFLAWTPPGYGQQRNKLAVALAQARLGAHEVFKLFQYLPVRLFPPHSQLIIVSPLLPQDTVAIRHLRAHGYQVMALCPDPVVFERPFLPRDAYTEAAERLVRLERHILFDRLRRDGVVVVEWDVTTPLWSAIQAELLLGSRTRQSANPLAFKAIEV